MGVLTKKLNFANMFGLIVR